jgi:type I restriction enzyme S subunit
MDADLFIQQFGHLVQGNGGIKKLCYVILQLAVSGKLVEQNLADEPAEVLLKKIEVERKKLAKEGKIKPPKITPKITSSEMPFALPKNWAWTRLGNLGSIFNGDSISASEKEQKYATNKSGYNYVATKDVDFLSRKINYENGVKIPFENKNFKIAHKGAVLICAEGGSAGKKIAITEEDICFGNKLYALEAFSGVSPYYLFYVYQSPYFFDEFSSTTTGIIGGTSINKFNQIPVPFPPLTEQKRIVAKVDELMALCGRLEAEQKNQRNLKMQAVQSTLHHLTNAENSASFATSLNILECTFDNWFDDLATVKRLRATILQLAVQGKLVPQNPTDEPASELLKSIKRKPAKIEGASNLFGLPSSWCWTELDQIIEDSRGISYGVIKLGVEIKGGIKTLRCSDVKFRYIDESSIKEISKEIADEYERTYLQGGEILINIRGTLGGCAIVPPHMKGYNIAREVAVVPVASTVCIQYILNVLTSPFIQQETLNNLRGIAYKGLNLSLLSKFMIPLPPLAEQKRIVAKVDELMTLCDQLEAHITHTQTLNAHLMDSLIHRMTEAV